MYFNGKGVAKDEAEAARWFRKAADQSIVDAQAELGWMYLYGRGVDKNDEAAAQWYRKAAEQGNAVASQRMMEKP